MSEPRPESTLPPIASAGEAEQVLTNLSRAMESLLATVAEETERVRAGHLRQAAELEPVKAELARHYAADVERIRQGRGFVAPEAVEALRRRHAAFHAALETNLTVLATAHAVSEGIIRGVSGELARKQAPTTYGASGRANAPGARASQPLALSRSL